MDKKAIESYIQEHRKTDDKSTDFVEYLVYLMDKHGFEKNTDLYQKAGLSRQYWHALFSGKTNPSLDVCIKLVFVLHASNQECKYLLKKAGYTLHSSSKYALIIRYFLENKNYNTRELNEALEAFGYEDQILDIDIK